MTIARFDLSAAPRISLEEAKKSFDRGVNSVFIDVRSTAEYDKAHIPGAISMPLREFPRRIVELPRDKEIITY